MFQGGAFIERYVSLALYHFREVKYEEDSRQRHQGSVIVTGEDHTLGNSIRH
jgi:hypothetical protein